MCLTRLIPAFMERIKILIGNVCSLATCLADANCNDGKWILQYRIFTGLTQSWDPFLWVRGDGMGKAVRGINSTSDIKYQIWV